MFDLRNSIIQMTSENNNLSLIVHEAIGEAIQRHAPIKYQHVRENQTYFMNKIINKEIMNRSRSRNTFLNIKCEMDKKTRNKQCNFCISSMRRKKKKRFSNISINDIIDKKTF